MAATQSEIGLAGIGLASRLRRRKMTSRILASTGF
jgi:hypothetical protein